MLTAEYLREVLHYTPETGVFVWRHNRQGHVKAGDVAGSVGSHGYVAIGIKGTKYLAHRLAWLYVHGGWPRRYLDHVSRDRVDNRIVNLREAEPWQNSANSPAHKDSSSGLRGVSAAKGKWNARVMVSGKLHLLGTFSKIEDADAAVRAARHLYAGEFAPY